MAGPYFNLNTCYIGTVGEYAKRAQFGYLARDLVGNVTRNTVTNGGDLPKGVGVGTNTSRIWSRNDYDLNANNYVWTVAIDGLTKTSTIAKLGDSSSIVTVNNLCPVFDPGGNPISLTTSDSPSGEVINIIPVTPVKQKA